MSSKSRQVKALAVLRAVGRMGGIGYATTRDRYGLLMRNNSGGAEMVTPVTEPMRTLTVSMPWRSQ